MALARDGLQSLLSGAAGVPGVSMAVVRHDSVEIHTAGLANTEIKVRVDRDTVFDVGSLGKPVFAYVVLQLVDAGQLTFETRLSEWAPDYVRDDPQALAVKVAHALSHTTGLPNWRSAELPLRAHCAPGDRFSYSGEGYTWLQRAVENITGQPLEALMHELVFGPLGMKNSSYIWRTTFEANYAAPYDASEQVGTKRKPEHAMAAFSLHTTAVDYARFLQAVLASARLGSGTAALWLAPQIAVWRQGILALPLDEPDVDTDVAWGLGWGLEPGQDVFFQWGDSDHGRYKSFAIGSVHDQEAVVVLTNGSRGVSIIPDLVEGVLPEPHPCFDWLGYQR